MKKRNFAIAASVLAFLSASAQKENRERQAQPQRNERAIERRSETPRMEPVRPAPQRNEIRTIPQPHNDRPMRTKESQSSNPLGTRIDRAIGQPQPDRANDNIRNQPNISAPQKNDNIRSERLQNNPSRPTDDAANQRTERSGFERSNTQNNRTRSNEPTFRPVNNGREVTTQQERRIHPNNGVRMNTPAPQQRNFTTNQFNRRSPFVVRNVYYPDYRRPYSYIGRRYTSFYRPRFYTPFFGINYCYSDGFFYRPYDSYFQIVIAPIGIHVYALPYGYRRFHIGPSMYYYYGGTYYTRNVANYYEVVDAPMGSILPELPEGTTVQVVDGHKYHVVNGTYYQETLRGDETWYTIVGKNGKISASAVDFKEDSDAAVGDIVTELPDDAKVLVLSNQKYYVADDVYYEEVIDNNTITYKVVAKPQ